MGNRKNSDEANSLSELSPVVQMRYAVYIPAFEKGASSHYSYNKPYCRYATKGHRAAGIKGLHVENYTLYTYNFYTEQWEEESDAS